MSSQAIKERLGLNMEFARGTVRPGPRRERGTAPFHRARGRRRLLPLRPVRAVPNLSPDSVAKAIDEFLSTVT